MIAPTSTGPLALPGEVAARLEGGPVARPGSSKVSLAGVIAEGVAGEVVGALRALKRRPIKAAAARKSRSSAAGYARASASTAKKSTSSTAKKTTTSSKKATGDLAFLDDPKLSTEEKLFKFLCYVEKSYDDEVEKKMKEFVAAKEAEKAKAAGGSGTKKSGLGSIVSAVKSFVPGLAPAFDLLKSKELQGVLKTIGGPVLGAAATALGFPELAPLVMKLAPQLVDLAGEAAKEMDGGSSAGKASSSGSSSTTTSGAEGTAGDSQIAMMELQRAQEKQKEMFGIVSNILRGMHDTRMAIVNNIRA
jgi:hypothetical protein